MGQMNGEPAISWDSLDSKKFIINGSLFIFLTDFILYPSDLLTTKLQVDRTSLLGKINLLKWTRQILKYEGFFGIYKGFTPTLLASFPGQLSYYFTYEYTNQRISKLLQQKTSLGTDSRNLISNCLAGFGAEIVSGFVYVPIEVLTQKLQIQQKITFLESRYQYRTTFDVFKSIIKSEGIPGLYRGFGAYVAVYGPNSAVWWVAYEYSKRLMLQQDMTFSVNCYWKHFAHFVAGAVAGAAAVVATNPLDVAKTRYQTMEYTNSLQKSQLTQGFIGALKRLYLREGFHGLYKGMKPRILLRIPGSAIAFVGYEMLKEQSLVGS